MEDVVDTPKVKMSYSMSSFRPSLLGASVFNVDDENDSKENVPRPVEEPIFAPSPQVDQAQQISCATPITRLTPGVDSATPGDVSSALKKLLPSQATESPLNLHSVFDEEKENIEQEASSSDEFPMDLFDEVSPPKLVNSPFAAEEKVSMDSTESTPKETGVGVLEFDDEEEAEEPIDEDALRETLSELIRSHMSDDALELSIVQWCERLQSQLPSQLLQSISMAKLKSLVKPLVVELASDYIMTHNANVEEQEHQATQEMEEAPLDHIEPTAEDGPANEELEAMRAIEKGISARAAAVAALLQRDQEALEQQAEELRSKILQRYQQRILPKKNAFDSQTAELHSFKSSLHNSGLMEAVKVLAESKRINLDENDDFITLSDDDDSESEGESEELASEEEDSVVQPAIATQSIFGGKCRAVKRQCITSTRTSMKLQLMQKAQASTTQRVAEKLGLATADDLYAVLAGVELERRRDVRQRADREVLARLKQEREQYLREQRREAYLRQLQDGADDSEEEFDGNEANYLTAVDGADIELSAQEESDEEEEEIDEETALMELEAVEAENDADEKPEENDNAAAEQSADLDNEEIVESANVNEEEEEEENSTSIPQRNRRISIDDEGGEGEEVTGVTRHQPVVGVSMEQDDVLMDSDVEEQDAADVAGVADKSISVSAQSDIPMPHKKERKGDKSSAYKKMLMEEERKERDSKKYSSLFDGEAEEEELVGLQGGLGDFGFGLPSVGKEAQDEMDALKVRDDDFDNIVDELSDGEDENDEERDKHYIDDQARQDRLKTKKILEALANGHTRDDRNAIKGHYGLDALARGAGETSTKPAGDSEEVLEEIDEDDEEALAARYLEQMKERRNKEKNASNEELSDEDEDDSDDDLAVEGDEEARREKRKRTEIEKETYRRFYQQACMRRVLRHAEKKSTDLTLLSDGVLPDRSLLGGSSANSLLAPFKQVFPSPTSVITLNENTNTTRPSGDTKRLRIDVDSTSRTMGAPLSTSSSLSRSGTTPRVSSGTASTTTPRAAGGFSGVLDKNEVELGYGSGLTELKRKQSTGSSLFATVTSGSSLKRSFTSMAARTKPAAMSVSTVSSKFVFMNEDSYHESRMDSRLEESNQLKRSSTLPSNKSLESTPTSSLFAKLASNARPQKVVRGHS